MYLIVPFTHEELQARRWPLLTIVLIVLNVVCLIALTFAMSGTSEHIEYLGEQAVDYRNTHPEVKDTCGPVRDVPRPPPRPRSSYERERSVIREMPLGESTSSIASGSIASGARLDDSSSRIASEQQTYDGLCSALLEAIDDTPLMRLGYVPGKNNFAGLITYQFLHGGWMHLISNLWFLWLCGCNLEDRWGRAVFLPFYLTAGIAAALMEKVFAPSSMIPLVGASGSIAGAMGAFLVTFARTRIKFAYGYFLLFRAGWGTFTAPAFIMLPLWLATEIFWGILGGSSTAHWAHVGGFLYGAAFAFTLQKTGLDAKLDHAMEQAVTKSLDPRILRAGDRINEGAPLEGLAILEQVAREQPRSIDVQLEILRAAKALADRGRELSAYVKLIELYFDTGLSDTAADLFTEMYALQLHEELTRGWTLKIADHLTTRRLYDRAEIAYATACREGIVDVPAVRATIAHARVLQQLRRFDQARALFQAARESPFSSAEIDAVIDAEMAKLGSAA